MGKIKFKVDKEAFDSAGFAEPPKPGVYACKIAEINAGFSKDEDGKSDPSRPRLEVIWEVTDKRYAGARIWDYVTFGSSTQWKLAQFLNALGLGSKENAEGEFDTKKLAPKGTDIGKTGKPITWTGSSKGAEAKIRVRGGTNQSGEYRAEVGAILPMGEDEEADAEDEFGDAEEEAEEEMVEDDEEFESEEEVEEITVYSEAELKALTPEEIKELATYWEISFKGKKKSEVIAAIIEAQEAATTETEEEEMPF